MLLNGPSCSTNDNNNKKTRKGKRKRLVACGELSLLHIQLPPCWDLARKGRFLLNTLQELPSAEAQGGSKRKGPEMSPPSTHCRRRTSNAPLLLVPLCQGHLPHSHSSVLSTGRNKLAKERCATHIPPPPLFA